MRTLYIISALLIGMISCNHDDEQSDAYGNFESREILVAAEANGRIMDFNAEEGMKVKAGKIIGVIDTTAFHLQKEQLKAQKKAVQARLGKIKSQIEVLEEQKENLIREKNRIQNLYREDAATEKQWDDIKGELKVMNKRIASARSEYEPIRHELESMNKQIAQIENRLSHCFIKNPVGGTILETYAENGELAATGRNLYKIADLSTLTLRVYVSGAQLPNIKLGQQVSVLIDKNKEANQELSGTVSWIAQSAEFTPKVIQTKEERVNQVYAVKIRVKNDGRLKIGMPGEVIF